MAARSSKGVQICMTSPTSLATSYQEIAITGITAGKVTKLGGAAFPTFKAGDTITIVDTGWAALDGKTFVLGGTPSATSLDLVGVDTTGVTTLVNPTAKAHVYDDTKFTCLCLNTITINSDTPGTISVGTYCDPTATLPSPSVQAGTISFGGYVDTGAKDYPALLDAEVDGLERLIRITLPNNGYIIMPVTIASLTWDLPIDGAVGFSGTGTLGSKPRHLFVRP